MNSGVKSLPGALGGSNSFALVEMVFNCLVKITPASLAGLGDPPGLALPTLHSLMCHLRGVWDSAADTAECPRAYPVTKGLEI